MNRFERTRRDHLLETAEDYVELVDALIRERGEARVVDIAELLQVSPATVTKVVRRLCNEGLLSSEPYRSVFLTESGRALAERSRERHELVLRFLRRLGVSDAIAEADAEGIEHHVSDETLTAMRRFLDHEAVPLGKADVES